MNDQNKWRKFSEEKPRHHQNIILGRVHPGEPVCHYVVYWGTDSTVVNQSIWTHWKAFDFDNSNITPPEPDKEPWEKAYDAYANAPADNSTGGISVRYFRAGYLAGAASK